jgi:hypothetical protein
MSKGYLYCMSNPSMPGIFKIGMTKRTPEIRLKEANSSDTWRPPTNYKIEFSQFVTNPKQKEAQIHKILKRNFERINDEREFFRAPIEDIKLFFDLMDNEIYDKKETENELIGKQKIIDELKKIK